MSTEILSVSVFIPARNEAGNIPEIFRRVPEMGSGTELVFVEGHSQDDTSAAIEREMTAYPGVPSRLLHQPGIGKADAVRAGFEAAKGDVLMILDARPDRPARGPASLLRGAPFRKGIGQALPNRPDMDYPAMGGAIANSVHATGNQFGSMSSYVAGLTLVTPGGELIECSATKNREIFQAARTSIGALGIVSRLVLQNQPSFELTEVSRIEKTEDVLDALAENCAKHRHYEFLPLTNSDLCVTVATNLARPGDANHGEDDPQTVNTLRKLFDAVGWLPGGSVLYDKLLGMAMGKAAATTKTGPSYQVFPHVRVVRFREMEYTVPAEAGPACVREILRTIREKKIPICFPLEYRYVKADDIWLSMFEGRDGCSISVHQFGDLDYKASFAEIEPIFWKHQSRPHWGKLHTLDAKRLAALYPRHWQDFQEVRRSLDPQGKMLNAHLKSIFGA